MEIMEYKIVTRVASMNNQFKKIKKVMLKNVNILSFKLWVICELLFFILIIYKIIITLISIDNYIY